MAKAKDKVQTVVVMSDKAVTKKRIVRCGDCTRRDYDPANKRYFHCLVSGQKFLSLDAKKWCPLQKDTSLMAQVVSEMKEYEESGVVTIAA